ncbi:MAG: hypothetical protein ACFFC7_09025 [Candidatus Hermodarchaeota archaeon]
MSFQQTDDQKIIEKIIEEWKFFKNSEIGQSNLVAIASQRIKNFLYKDELEKIGKRFLDYINGFQIDKKRFSYSETYCSAQLQTSDSVNETLLIPFDFVRLFIAAKKEVQASLEFFRIEKPTLDEFIVRVKSFLLNQRIHLTKNDINILKICVEPKNLFSVSSKFTQNAQAIKKHMNCSLATVYNSLNKLKTLEILENKLHISYSKLDLHPYLLKDSESIKVALPMLYAGTNNQKKKFSIVLLNRESKIPSGIASNKISFLQERWNLNHYRNRREILFPHYPKNAKPLTEFKEGIRTTFSSNQKQIDFDFHDLQIIDYLNHGQKLESILEALAIDEKEVLQRVHRLYSEELIFPYPSLSMIGLPVAIYYYIKASKDKLNEFRTFLEAFPHYYVFGGENFIFGISQIPMSWVHQLWDVLDIQAQKFEEVSFGILTKRQRRNNFSLASLWDEKNQSWKEQFL